MAKPKKKKVAWGITGSGDRLIEIVETMTEIKNQYQDKLDIRVFLSQAGDQVIKYYRLLKPLKENFEKIEVERNPNAPFLAGQLQIGKYEFLLIAPSTSNTTAKISLGISDSMLTNSAIMALKAFIPVYIMPSDYKIGMVVTTLPNREELKIRVRKEDYEHVQNLRTMDKVTILEELDDLHKPFQPYNK
jgi:archaeoflavoprotein AfpA